MKKIIVFLLLISVIACKEENQPPTCEITYPDNNASFGFGNDIKISVEASDPDGLIHEIQLYFDEIGIVSLKEFPYTHTLETGDYDPGEYEIKAIAIDEEGLDTSDEIKVTISALLATLTTNAITSVKETSAVSGGNITSDGGTNITARGVCWSENENPTLSDNHTTDGTGTGSFSSNLTELSSSLTYYVRAYATNSAGTAYGDEIEFTTRTISNPVTDIEGNIYETVVIGTQTWMAENLKTTTYNDGTTIPNVTDENTWKNLGTGAYCWYDNDEASYKDTYGALYNWYAVETEKLCPTGWHVPTESEWTTLVNYSGGKSEAGGKLKEAGTTHWISPNKDATNESGFTALPGSHRFDDGRFLNLGYYALFWTSTEAETMYAWYILMYNNYKMVEIDAYENTKKAGYSVRCVKDQP